MYYALFPGPGVHAVNVQALDSVDRENSFHGGRRRIGGLQLDRENVVPSGRYVDVSEIPSISFNALLCAHPYHRRKQRCLVGGRVMEGHFVIRKDELLRI